MNRNLRILVIYLLLHLTNSYYFNMGHFLKPILDPKQDIYGSTLRSDDAQRSDTISFFDTHIKKHKHQFQINRARRAGISTRQNLRMEDEVEDDLYQAIGIPENIIYSKVLPIHMSARRDLYLYFPKHRITKKRLMQSLKKLKELIEWILETYLTDVNTIIIGDNNYIQGSNIYVKGDNMTIKGTTDFVFNPNYQNRSIIGNNIVRIGAFDVDLDEIDKIKRCPEDAITFLEGK